VFGDWNKCGEVMGLAPTGRIRQAVHAMENGELKVAPWPAGTASPGSPNQRTKMGSQPFHEHWEDLAWRIQEDTEQVPGARQVAARAQAPRTVHRRRRPQLRRQRQARPGWLRECLVQPAAGDDGIAIGCAYYGHLAIQGNRAPRGHMPFTATLPRRGG
jgi:carbamoyltransferase